MCFVKVVMFKPWLLCPVQLGHDIAPLGLKVLAQFQGSNTTPEYDPFVWRGLHFANRMGVAGGVDKEGHQISSWKSLGAGFHEVGTITLKPQTPNPGKILRRNVSRRELWNCMGFPSPGSEVVKKEIDLFVDQHPKFPLFINIGKNRQTPLDQAGVEYKTLFEYFADVAKVVVINISSPNTAQLRELQQKKYLEPLLKPLIEHRGSKQKIEVLVKVSPDQTETSLKEMIQVSASLGVSGWILSNTTTVREPGSDLPKEGGVSGAPLTLLSRQCLKWAVEELGNKKGDQLIVSSGGILDASEIQRRREMGADLIQVYSALIFEGPWFFRKMISALSKAVQTAKPS